MGLLDPHTVYNSLGVQIGYYDTLQDLANGVVHFQAAPGKSLSGMSMESPASWQVDCGFFAQRKGVTECLLSQGLVPSWATADQVTQAQNDNAPIGWGDILPAIDLNIPALPEFSNPFGAMNTALGVNLPSYAILAGLGLFGVILLAKKL